MTILLKATQKPWRHAGIEDHLMNASTSWPFTSQRGDFGSQLSKRLIPSINVTCMLQENNFWSFENLIWYCSRATLSVILTFVLASSSWAYERSLRGPLLHALRFPVRLRRIVWISLGLRFCDRSEIESKSSMFRCLSPRRLVTSPCRFISVPYHIGRESKFALKSTCPHDVDH